MRFRDEIAIVIDRYDRARVGGTLIRVHQEDMCQAHGLPPTKKYENEGGPSVRQIVDLLRNHSISPDEDVQRFIDAIAYNWQKHEELTVDDSPIQLHQPEGA